ncbi:MAG TPA: nuclear transport factor 2 family protein [Xanthomonadaceae bacterium]|nr:nuclear transport factor 2 family protein [Xanthomonadaceae bacterium]
MRIQRPARRFLLLSALLGLVATIAAYGADANPPDAEHTRSGIAAMLTTFLTPAVNDSAAGHERFWADDLVYTSSSGKVMGNADIMKSFADAPKAEPGKKSEPDPVFTAEDILVRPYGDAAALTFRLVEHDHDGKISYFRNSGTFLWRHGKWQAITWQATRVAVEGK